MYLDQDIEPEDYRKDKNNLVSEKKSLEEQIARLEQKQIVGSNLSKLDKRRTKTGRNNAFARTAPQKIGCTKNLWLEPVFKKSKN